MHIKETTETGAVVFIPLTQGKVAVIDFADFEKVRGCSWRAFPGRKGVFYAATGSRRATLMHRLLTNAMPGQKVDHKDNNGLNNQRGNIRIATTAQNSQNSRKKVGTTSQFKGVHWDKRKGKWSVAIVCSSKQTFLGYFTDEKDAARAYDAAALTFFGEFAAPNFK